METQSHAHAAFHITGRIDDDVLSPIAGRDLIPAVFASLRDLSTLRYDFPLVLVDDGDEGSAAPLSGVIDDLLDSFTDDPDEGRIRKHVLRLESGIRALTMNQVRLSLREAWESVAKELVAVDEGMSDSLARALDRLSVDGALIDCDGDTATDVLVHAWRASFTSHATAFRATVAELLVRLDRVLAADFENSPEARTAASLRSTFGSGPMDEFNFEAMSELLSHPTAAMALPDSRRERIQRIMAILQSQHFYSDPTLTDPDAYSFMFDNCEAALAAFRDRLPSMVDVAKAIAVGKLEADGDYVEAKHDPVFANFGDNGLDATDLALFPDYLIVLRGSQLSAQEHEQLTQVLSSGLPFTVLVQTDDVVEPSPVGRGYSALALTSHRLTSMAMGLADVFVLQAPVSHLFAVQSGIHDALAYQGPSLVSVYSGAGAEAPGLPSYLIAAAALESRVFPIFCYDPSAGPDWASRFSIEGNPQLESPWPRHDFAYEDAQTQSVSVEDAFTLADFVACDRRYAAHFAIVEGDGWSEDLVPVDDTVDRSLRGVLDHVPSVYLVDPSDRLHRVILDESVLREVRRSAEMWSSLSELAGMNNSYVRNALALAQAQWQEERAAAILAASADLAAVAAEPVVVEEVVEVEELVAIAEPPARDPDVAYIETPRCSTCNECTQINGKMFAYNDNQQAYIADITAGTYAQLVEAAESCQVSVIHPGKPLDPNEPGLPDLLVRAEPFL